MGKVALITGANGGDGKYLQEILYDKNYSVYCYNGDILDSRKLHNYIVSVLPDEIYHLAALSSIKECEIDNIKAIETNCIATLSIINTIRYSSIKLFFAGSSAASSQTMYGLTKEFSTQLINLARKDDIFACTGIMHNHTGKYSSNKFVVKKFIEEVVKIKYNKSKCVYVGNLETCKDFGYAKDYMNAAHLMLQQDRPKDYIISSNNITKIKDILYYIFLKLNIDDPEKYIKVDKSLFKKDEQISLKDYAAHISELGWRQTKTIYEVIDEMIEYECKKYI